jgi:hypothetical protein
VKVNVQQTRSSPPCRSLVQTPRIRYIASWEPLQPDAFHPAEHLFDTLACFLTELITTRISACSFWKNVVIFWNTKSEIARVWFELVS